jgi:hypothetical protein
MGNKGKRSAKREINLRRVVIVGFQRTFCAMEKPYCLPIEIKKALLVDEPGANPR